MSATCSIVWYHLPKYQFSFNFYEAFTETSPALNITMRALSQITTKNHLIMYFSAHFIPFDEYTGTSPTGVPESVRNRIKNTFSKKTNLLSIIFQDDELLVAPVPYTTNGSYLGREKETDIEIINIYK
ncbi:unnamed protein product [Adineta steineri]|uniref:Uncharacterized protein n=1 Tax=Adineta steineri TaxID=433720 RepID=A0A819VL03_9BILA|nr:unnamed protein product [Adineta steineri]CAF1069682.1 unnamed protein product [Adineta steineri]CAF3700675.1 unnamed protein product [Adineta steineri]CAF4110843.1 unnamed protein product [Adineta steineri]